MQNKPLLFKFLALFLGSLIGASFTLIFYFNFKLKTLEKKVEVKINDQYIIAEVADNEKLRTKGLSGKKVIGVNEGMLFLFDAPGNYGFWMKDMKFPIDLVWIFENKVVGFEKHLMPLDKEKPNLRIYYPPRIIDKVLELKAGRVDLLKLKIGDEVFIRPILKK